MAPHDRLNILDTVFELVPSARPVFSAVSTRREIADHARIPQFAFGYFRMYEDRLPRLVDLNFRRGGNGRRGIKEERATSLRLPIRKRNAGQPVNE